MSGISIGVRRRRILAAVFMFLAVTLSMISCGGGGGVDSTPAETPTPDAPVISGIATGLFNTNQTFTITGKSGATIEYTTDGGSSWNTYSGAVILSGEDTYLVAARQTADGKTSANTVTIQVIIDKTLPGAPTISGISTGYYNTNQTFTVTGTESLIEYSTNGGSTWTTYSVPVTLSTENSYTVTARQTDTAGNVSSTATPIVLTVDKSVSAPIISGVVTGSYNEEQDVTITGEAGATIEYSINGGADWSAYPTGGVALSSEGDYTITARQTDLAGNASGNAASVHVIIDTTLPDAPVITGISAGIFNFDQAFTVSGESNATIQYSTNGGTNWLSYSGEVTLHDDGAYTVVAKQTDLAGNPSGLSTSYAVTIDQTDPANVTNPATAISHQKIVLSWTEPTGDATFSKVRITFTPAAGSVSQPIEVLKGTTTAQITPLIDGTEYTFTVVSVDTAGNESSGVTISATPGDTTPPEPGNGAALTVSNVQNRSFWITWTEATDDVSTKSQLLYKIVRSTSNNISTVADAETSGGGRTVVKDWTTDLCWTGGATSWELVRLTPGAAYYYAVLVKDNAGNKNIYTGGPQTTLAGYTMPSVNGTVHAMALDGTNLYIGGSFTTVGGYRNGAIIDKTTSEISFMAAPPCVNAAVYYTIPDGNGGWYICGEFTQVNGVTRNRVARINADGSLHAWNPNVNNTVHEILVSGSTVYLAGDFTSVGGTARNRLAAVGTDGSLLSWNPNADNSVRSLAVGGSVVYVGGSFTSIGGTSRTRLAAIGTDGTLTSWAPTANNYVHELSVSGGIVYAGGQFTTINGTTRNRLAAIGTDGTLASWDPNANNNVISLEVSGSTVYVGGDFTAIGGTVRNRIAAIGVDGSLASWDPNANNTVWGMYINGSEVFMVGAFTSVGGSARTYIASIGTDGTLSSWAPRATGTVMSLAPAGDTVFTAGNGIVIGGTTRNRLAAIGQDGTLLTWNPNANGGVVSLVVSGTTVYVGGNFNLIGGQTRSYMAALDASTGNAITTWNANANGDVFAIAVSGTTVFAGGNFSSIGGQARNNIAALDAGTGNAVTTWDPNASSTVYALAVTGTTIYAGGNFTSVGGQTRNRIAALDAGTGNAVVSWNPSASDAVRSLAVSGTTVYAGGIFTSIGGQSRNRVAALDASTGNAVTTWNPGANDIVITLAVSGTNLYAGGNFTTIGGQARNYIAVLDAGTGNAVTTWNPNAGSTVYSLALTGANVYAGGDFTSIGGIMKSRLAAIDTTTGLPW